MGDIHTGPKHPLSDAEVKSYSNLHMVPPGFELKGEGVCMSLVQYNQVAPGRYELARLRQLPT